MNDFASKLGDGKIHRVAQIIKPQQLPVNVGRQGIDVVLTIGNSDPLFFHYKEAMRMGSNWMKEANRAKKENRSAQIQIGHNKLNCPYQAAHTIGHWMVTKGAEAKFLDGDSARLDI